MLVKVVLVSQTDVLVGAGRAAYRLHDALRANGVDSAMTVRYKQSDDPTVATDTRFRARLAVWCRSRIEDWIVRRRISNASEFESFTLVPTRWSRTINRSDVEVAFGGSASVLGSARGAATKSILQNLTHITDQSNFRISMTSEVSSTYSGISI